MSGGLWHLRVAAKLIDASACGFIGATVGVRIRTQETVAWPVGTGLALFLLWLLDGIQGGAWGKSAMGLKCVDASTGRAAGGRQALQRNLPVLVLAPGLWALGEHLRDLPVTPWAAGVGALGLVWVVLEVWWMATRADGRRLGDAMGDTVVVRKTG